MLERLESIERRYEEINALLSRSEVLADLKSLQALGQERAALEGLVTRYREYKATVRSLEETRSLAGDSDEAMATLVEQEMKSLESRRDRLLQDLKRALLPRDPADEKDVIVEIRAGVGGDEAELFAADLFRMYSRYAASRGWGMETMSSNQSGIGGFKEIVFEIKGKGAFSRLKYERGVHRVQRVPITEAGGRIHTSTATVAVLPEPEEVEVQIAPDELKMDTFRASGAGGQHVNKVSTAVRITHLPTGMVVACQDERSQWKNRMKALTVLRARLLDKERRQQAEAEAASRRSQVGSGERSEKIRTYNFPQDRVSDHRIGLTLHNLQRILDGDLNDLIDAVATEEETKHLEEKVA